MVQHPSTAPLAEPLAGDGVVGRGASPAVAVDGEHLGLGELSSLLAAADGARLGIVEEGVARARAGGDRRVLAECLTASGRAHMFVAQIPAARQRFLECLAVADHTGEAAVADAHVGLGWAALAQGDYRAASTHLELALALTGAGRPDGEPSAAAARVWSAELAARRGDDDTARGLYQATLAIAPRARAPHPSTRALVGLGRLALANGDLDGAGHFIDEALALARQAGDAHLVALCLEALGALALARGEVEQARGTLGQAVALARRHHDRLTEAAAQEQLGRLARAQGDVAAAAGAHGQALALRAQVGDRAGVADSLEALGRVGVAEGRPGPGVRLMAAAHALRQHLEHPRPPVDAEGHGADLSVAREALGTARFEEEWAAGVRLRAEEAVAVAACAGFGGPTTGWDVLSPAECTVVELVGEDLTNAEIAERLGISPWTVRSHLRHVFAKLGLPGRGTLQRAVQAR